MKVYLKKLKYEPNGICCPDGCYYYKPEIGSPDCPGCNYEYYKQVFPKRVKIVYNDVSDNCHKCYYEGYNMTCIKFKEKYKCYKSYIHFELI